MALLALLFYSLALTSYCALRVPLPNCARSSIKSIHKSFFELSVKRRTNIRKTTNSNVEIEPSEETAPEAQQKFDLKASDMTVIQENTRIQKVTKENRNDVLPTISVKNIDPVTSTVPKKKVSLFDELEGDLASFESRSRLIDYQSKLIKPEAIKEDGAIMKYLKNSVSTVLIVDFFVVIVFLVWFLAAAALQKTYPVVLERFQDIFQPVVVPSLTVLMAGSILSGVIGDKEKEKN